MKLVSIFKKPTVLLGLLLTLFFSSVIIILAIYLGHQAGNFVVQIEGGDLEKAILISENLETDGKSRLEATGYSGLSHTTYSYFSGRLDEYTSSEGGGFDEHTYVYHYSFYILNENQTAIDIKTSLYYSNATNGVEDAIRVMTIASVSEDPNVYQTVDLVEKDYGIGYPKTNVFLNDNTVCEETYLAFEPNSYIKYTVLIWLEGNDPECVDSVLNGSIKFTMKISII